MGNVGGLFIKNGVLFTFFQDITSTGGYKIGYYSDGIIVDVGNYSGGLPAFYQITDYKDYITWNSNGNYSHSVQVIKTYQLNCFN